MVVLKKIKSATLVEAMVATVLVIVIFIVASAIINNLLLNTFTKNTHQQDYHFNELEYDLQNGKIAIPFNEVNGDWEITIQTEKVEGTNAVVYVATNTKTHKTVTRTRIYAK